MSTVALSACESKDLAKEPCFYERQANAPISKAKRRRKRSRKNKHHSPLQTQQANANSHTISPVHDHVDLSPSHNISYSIFEPLTKRTPDQFMLNPHSHHAHQQHFNRHTQLQHPSAHYTDAEQQPLPFESPSFGALSAYPHSHSQSHSHSYSHHPSTPLYSTHSPSLTAENIISNELFLTAESNQFTSSAYEYEYDYEFECGVPYTLTLQARVKAEMDLCSEWITDLPVGTFVEIECTKGDRLKICSPINGWISCIAKDGQSVLCKASVEDHMQWELTLADVERIIIPHQIPQWALEIFFADYPPPKAPQEPEPEVQYAQPHVEILEERYVKNTYTYEDEPHRGFVGFVPFEKKAKSKMTKGKVKKDKPKKQAAQEWNDWSKELKAAEMIYQKALRR